MSTLEGRVQFAEATAAQLEKDLTTTREHSEKELMKELKLREDMESKMKGEYEGQCKALGEKTTRQAKEMELLYKKVGDLQSELSSKVADFEIEKDEAVSAARQEEAKRQEATMAEQKQKIDMFLKGRGELQNRCEEYLKELTSSKESQKVTNEQVQKFQKECEGLKKRNTQLSDLNDEQSSQLTLLNDERATLKAEVRELELAAGQYAQQRVAMFKDISERIQSCVGNELDQLANKLQIVEKS